MGGVKTLEEARALPEVASPQYVDHLVTGADGVTTLHREYRKLCARGIDGDDILIFTDSDGRTMAVEWLEEGPVKTLARI